MFIQLKTRKIFVAAFMAALTGVASASHAAVITGLFNTGVNGAGTPLVGTGTPDPHYSLIASPAPATAVTVNDPGYPIGVWALNSATSRWIGPAGDSNGPGGNYIYRTTFNLPANAVLSTVNISGFWGVDDVLSDLLVNGNSTAPATPFYTPLSAFTIPTGSYQIGINTLDFLVLNANIGTNPTGLRIEGIKGTYRTVPEPATASLAAMGLMFFAALVRRRRTTNFAEAAMI